MSRISFVKSKIVSLDEAILKVNTWKIQNHKIVFTNGCFDILHVGHVSYLAKAADLGSKLVVALNTDLSVKKLSKGENRPINNESSRLQVIASLAFVDLVFLFNEETPLESIKALLPNVIVKGADYDPNVENPRDKKYIVGSDIMKDIGGEVKIIEFEEGFSTTSIIAKINS
jgi:D-glycero-beta-D-manno-heptose 1-phosphate adenylyltransferase